MIVVIVVVAYLISTMFNLEDAQQNNDRTRRLLDI